MEWRSGITIGNWRRRTGASQGQSQDCEFSRLPLLPLYLSHPVHTLLRSSLPVCSTHEDVHRTARLILYPTLLWAKLSHEDQRPQKRQNKHTDGTGFLFHPPCPHH